jgi:hypothetical protein
LNFGVIIGIEKGFITRGMNSSWRIIEDDEQLAALLDKPRDRSWRWSRARASFSGKIWSLHRDDDDHENARKDHTRTCRDLFLFYDFAEMNIGGFFLCKTSSLRPNEKLAPWTSKFGGCDVLDGMQRHPVSKPPPSRTRSPIGKCQGCPARPPTLHVLVTPPPLSCLPGFVAQRHSGRTSPATTPQPQNNDGRTVVISLYSNGESIGISLYRQTLAIGVSPVGISLYQRTPLIPTDHQSPSEDIPTDRPSLMDSVWLVLPTYSLMLYVLLPTDRPTILLVKQTKK